MADKMEFITIGYHILRKSEISCVSFEKRDGRNYDNYAIIGMTNGKILETYIDQYDDDYIRSQLK